MPSSLPTKELELVGAEEEVGEEEGFEEGREADGKGGERVAAEKEVHGEGADPEGFPPGRPQGGGHRPGAGAGENFPGVGDGSRAGEEHFYGALPEHTEGPGRRPERAGGERCGDPHALRRLHPAGVRAVPDQCAVPSQYL